MESSDDPYEILGVQPDTDLKEIKKAYRKLAMEYHPDKQLSEEDMEKAHNVFAKISAAYEVVSDPSKRYDWDMLRQKGRRRPVHRNSQGNSPNRTRSTNTIPTRHRSTNSPPPPSSPGLFRSRPKRTGSPSKPRDRSKGRSRDRSNGRSPSPGVFRSRSTRDYSPSDRSTRRSPSPGVFRSRPTRSGSSAIPSRDDHSPSDRSTRRSPSPGVFRTRPTRARDDHSPPKRNYKDTSGRKTRRSSYTGPPTSPGGLSGSSRSGGLSGSNRSGGLSGSNRSIGSNPLRHSIASPDGVARRHVNAAASSGALDGLRMRPSVTERELTPPSPGTIRPQGRPRPRPVGPNGEQRHKPRKHASTGNLRPRNSGGSLSPRNNRPSRQMSAGTLRRKFRDPFLIFEEVMEEEFGKGFRHKPASGWNKSEDGEIIGGEKKLSAKKEFKKLDLNDDKALSKDELRNLIESNEEMWAVLGGKLNLKRETCIRIATEVAFSLAKGEEVPKKAKKRTNNTADANTYELTETEFKGFYKNYVLSQKGSYDFFLRTIFAFYDINGDGVLQRDEFENFCDLFYKTKDVYKQKMETMPSKTNLLRIAEARLDKTKDGTLSFEEVRDLLQVAMVVTQ